MTAREIEHENISTSRYAEDLAAVAKLSGADPAQLKGYVLLVDDGSDQAKVCTDLDLPDCAGLLYRVTELLFGGAQ